jgi:predicted transcriptional regulator
VNAVVNVVDPQRIGGPAGSGTGDNGPVWRAKLGSFFPRMYRIALRRLARLRTAGESDYLACYTLALLLSELRMRGERAAVLVALLDMCLRLPGGWFASRSQMSKLLRRWLGDSAARVASQLWAQPPPGVFLGLYGVGVEEDFTPGGRVQSYSDCSRWQLPSNLLQPGERNRRLSIASRDSTPPALSRPTSPSAPLSSPRSVNRSSLLLDAPLTSCLPPTRYVVFSDQFDEPTSVMREAASFNDGMAGETVLHESPGSCYSSSGGESEAFGRGAGARSPTRLAKLAGPTAAKVTVRTALSPASRADIAAGATPDPIFHRILACQRALAAILDMAMSMDNGPSRSTNGSGGVDQLLLELLLALLRHGAWQLASAPFVESMLFFIQVPLDNSQRMWMQQTMISLYMPTAKLTVVQREISAALSVLAKNSTQSRLPPLTARAFARDTDGDLMHDDFAVIALARKLGTKPAVIVNAMSHASQVVLGTQRSISSDDSTELSDYEASDPCSIIQSSARRGVVTQLATALLRRVRMTALHMQWATHREQEIPVILVSANPAAQTGGDPDFKRPDGGRSTTPGPDAGTPDNTPRIGVGSGPRTPNRHTGWLPSVSAKRINTAVPDQEMEAVRMSQPSNNVRLGGISPRPADALDSAARVRAALREAVSCASISFLTSQSGWMQVRDDVLGDGVRTPSIAAAAAYQALATAVSAHVSSPSAVGGSRSRNSFDSDYVDEDDDEIHAEVLKLVSNAESADVSVPQLGSLKDLCACIASIVKEWNAASYGYESRSVTQDRIQAWRARVSLSLAAAVAGEATAANKLALAQQAASSQVAIIAPRSGAYHSSRRRFSVDLVLTAQPHVEVPNDSPAPTSPIVLTGPSFVRVPGKEDRIAGGAASVSSHPAGSPPMHPGDPALRISLPMSRLESDVLTPKAIRAITPQHQPTAQSPLHLNHSAGTTPTGKLGDSNDMTVGAFQPHSSHSSPASESAWEPVQQASALTRKESVGPSIVFTAMNDKRCELLPPLPVHIANHSGAHSVPSLDLARVDVSGLPVPTSVAPPRVGPARLVIAFAQALVRLSPTTCGEYDVLLKTAAIMCEDDDAVARFITTKLLNSWPSSEAEKEKACLALICNALPHWYKVRRVGGSCLDVDGLECGILTEDDTTLVRRVVARVALCIKSRNTSVANEAVMQCLPKAMPSSRGQAKASPFGAFLLTDPVATLAISRALEVNSGVMRHDAESPESDATADPQEALSTASPVAIVPPVRVAPLAQPLDARRCSSTRRPARVNRLLIENRDVGDNEAGTQPVVMSTRNLEFGRRAATRIKQRPGLLRIPGSYTNPTVGLVGFSKEAVDMPEMLETGNSSARRTSSRSSPTLATQQSNNAKSTSSLEGSYDGSDSGESSGSDCIADSFGASRAVATRELTRKIPRTRSVRKGASISARTESAHNTPKERSKRRARRLSRSISSDFSAEVGLLSCPPATPSNIEQRNSIRKMVHASLSLTDSVIMAVECHMHQLSLATAVARAPADHSDSPSKEFPTEKTVVSSPTMAAAPLAGMNSHANRSGSVASAVAAPPLRGIRPLSASSSPNSPNVYARFPSPHHGGSYGISATTIKLPAPPGKKSIVYSGMGHWSNTVRYNSMVVLQQLDRAIKDRLAALHEELQRNSDIDVHSIIAKALARRQKHHALAEQGMADGLDGVSAIAQARRTLSRHIRPASDVSSTLSKREPMRAFSPDMPVKSFQSMLSREAPSF